MWSKILIFLKIKKRPPDKPVYIQSKGVKILTKMKARHETIIHTFPKEYFMGD